MNALKIVLVLQFIGIIVYSLVAGSAEGWDLLRVFFENLTALNWSGQFNYDFLCYLTLSGIWVAWRNQFSGLGILLGIAASILGILFFAPYLLLILNQSKGNLVFFFFGPERARTLDLAS